MEISQDYSVRFVFITLCLFCSLSLMLFFIFDNSHVQAIALSLFTSVFASIIVFYLSRKHIAPKERREMTNIFNAAFDKNKIDNTAANKIYEGKDGVDSKFLADFYQDFNNSKKVAFYGHTGRYVPFRIASDECIPKEYVFLKISNPFMNNSAGLLSRALTKKKRIDSEYGADSVVLATILAYLECPEKYSVVDMVFSDWEVFNRYELCDDAVYIQNFERINEFPNVYKYSSASPVYEFLEGDLKNNGYSNSSIFDSLPGRLRRAGIKDCEILIKEEGGRVLAIRIKTFFNNLDGGERISLIKDVFSSYSQLKGTINYGCLSKIMERIAKDI